MMRATGFLAGVCLTVAAFLLALDSRDTEQSAILTQAGEKASAEELSGVVAAIAEQVDVLPAEIEPDQAVPPDPESGAVEGELQNGVEVSGLEQDDRLDVRAQAQADASDQQVSGDTSTYLFWSPFRSEWAAQGFAGRLSSATQVPVEVFNAGPGRYRVAFSYQDETQRQARIDRIETITGLKLE